MVISQTRTFAKQVQKLHKNQKADLDEAVQEISKNPLAGEPKKADLIGIRVYKFKMINQLTLLAYEYYEDKELILLALGSHENFYRDLKN